MLKKSIQYLWQQAEKSFKRFPYSIFAAKIASFLAVLLIELPGEPEDNLIVLNALLATSLGISMFFCFEILFEDLKWPKSKVLWANLVILFVLIGLFFTLPFNKNVDGIAQPYIRFGLFALVSHLMVSFIPYLYRKSTLDFWNYNKILFVRLVSAIIYSAIIFFGLLFAIYALKQLFNIEIPEKLIADLFFSIAFVFNTWFFIGGIPENFDHVDDETQFPSALKILIQYVLLPLMSLYFIILYAYVLKIVFTWNWPSGIVSYLIIAISFFGIFLYLLAYPLKDKKEYYWIGQYLKWYFFALLPLVIILFISIGLRVADYGYTINRYLVVIIGIWLSIVCFYFIKGEKNIRMIPISLSVFLLVISFGPWGMFQIPAKSQTKRLEEILNKFNLIENGKIKNEQYLSFDTSGFENSKKTFLNNSLVGEQNASEVSSIVEYLSTYHHVGTVSSLLKQDVDSLVLKQKKMKTNLSTVYLNALGFEKYSNTDNLGYFNFTTQDEMSLVSTKDYDFVGKFNFFDEKNRNGQDGSDEPFIESYKLDGSILELELILSNKEKTKLKFDLEEKINDLYKNNNKDARVEINQMEIEKGDEKVKIKLIFEDLTGNKTVNKIDLNHIRCYVLLKEL